MRNAAELAFLRTVELGSIRAAARALGQDPSGISRRITQLERRLGTKLVDRTGNATAPTAQGQVYFERLKAIIDQLEALEAEISGEDLHPSGLLRVTAAIDFGQEFLTDWLLEFQRQHPKVAFELILSSGFLDLNQNSIDVALRVGSLPDSSLVARRIATVPRVLVASPDYLRRKGRPSVPSELADHDFIFFAPQNKSQALELIDAEGESVRVKRSGPVTINAVRSAVKAVLGGHGIHSGPLWAFADLIASGRVEIVLPDHRQREFPLFAVRQPSVVVPARVARFIDFIAARVSDVKGLEVPGDP